MQLSVVIITYNEERNVQRCLDSVRGVADEVVVLDSGSTDATVAICQRAGARVHTQAFVGHIEQKNAAMALAQHDWLLSLDADEALSTELKSAVLALKQTEIAPNCAFSMNRLNQYAGHWVRHGGWYPDRKVRLWHRSAGAWGGENPHDKVVLVAGTTVAHLQGDLLHHAYANAAAHHVKIEQYARIAAEAKFAAGKRSNWLLVLFAPIWRFIQAYFLQLGFLDGRVGWQIATISAREKYLKYHFLLQMR